MHTFLKGISIMWNANNLILESNLGQYTHFLWCKHYTTSASHLFFLLYTSGFKTLSPPKKKADIYTMQNSHHRN